MNKQTQIVLLGGGYVTVWAYRALVAELKREISSGEVSIVVVCPDDHHFFHGWTAESLTGIVQDQHRMSPLSELLPKAHLIKGFAEEIIHRDNLVRIKTAEGATDYIRYDHLLVGIGSHDSVKIDGIAKHGYQIKSHASFVATRERIRSIVHQAAHAGRPAAEKLLQFTVCGGGLLGVELVTNLAEFLALLMEQHASLKNVRPAIRLVTGGGMLDSLDPGLKKMRAYAEDAMIQYRIEVIRERKVLRIDAGGAVLDDHTRLESSMVISAIGQSRITLEGTERMKRDQLGRLCTDNLLQIPGYQNIWGGGDACAIPQHNTNGSCISNALWAMKHGEHAANNIVRSIRKQPLKPFTYRGLGQCASLGIGMGVGELYGFEFTGWIAWTMRWFIFNYFMPSKRVMLGGIADWLYMLFLGSRRGLQVVKPASISRERGNFTVLKKAEINVYPKTSSI